MHCVNELSNQLKTSTEHERKKYNPLAYICGKESKIHRGKYSSTFFRFFFAPFTLIVSGWIQDWVNLNALTYICFNITLT